MAGGLSTLNPLIFVTANKRKHSQITDEKTKAHRAGGTCQSSKLLWPKPKTRKALPLWTSLVHLNQCHWDFISQTAEESFRDFFKGELFLPNIQFPTSRAILRRMRRNNLEAFTQVEP